ncbi:MAG: hypothetical protein E7102_12770 [Prevotella ruminicola]|uniref:Uncharacterized protein n=1 Tax=Xylanibacter ruminicola TaxID=839 RepID=A0A928BU97_XYLRU|nr:hypothetical protein [Xylanibacter ruminicola]
MRIKKVKDKQTDVPQKKKRGEKAKGKMTKAREAIRAEIRLILDAAREQNLIQKTTSTVRKVRTFTTEDIMSFISDVKVKTKEEVKKVIPKRESSPDGKSSISITTNSKVEAPPKQKTMSYYDRWYDLVSRKGK